MFWVKLGLNLLSWFLDWSNASDNTKKKFLELVKATKDDGLITVKTHDTFANQYKTIMNNVANDDHDGNEGGDNG